MPDFCKSYVPRPTEDVARKMLVNSFFQAWDALNAYSAQGMATAAKSGDEFSDVCRVVEKEYLRREALEDIRETTEKLAPGRHPIRGFITIARTPLDPAVEATLKSVMGGRR